jgi:hypothetical protein
LPEYPEKQWGDAADIRMLQPDGIQPIEVESRLRIDGGCSMFVLIAGGT